MNNNKYNIGRCAICGKPIIEQFGCNPFPIRDSNLKCCQWCDEHLVIPLRLRQMTIESEDMTEEKEISYDEAMKIIAKLENGMHI